MTALDFDESCLIDAKASQSAIAQLEAGAQRVDTRSGVVWRRWGNGPPLVLLHGDQGNWMHWARNIPALARHFTLWIADMPGFGESSVPKPTLDFADIADRLVESLNEILGGEARIDLVGFSLGGRIAGPVLARMEGRIPSLFLAAAGGLGFANDAMPAIVSLRSATSAEEFAEVHRSNLANFMLADPACIDACALYIQARGSRLTRAKIVRPDVDELPRVLRATAARIHCISGTRDHYLHRTLEQRRALFRTLQAGAEWELIEGPGHWMMYEAADAFNAALLRFHGMRP